jgi:hypothetical protein
MRMAAKSMQCGPVDSESDSELASPAELPAAGTICSCAARWSSSTRSARRILRFFKRPRSDFRCCNFVASMPLVFSMLRKRNNSTCPWLVRISVSWIAKNGMSSSSSSSIPREN